MAEKEDKTIGFIPESTKCEICYEVGANHFDGDWYYCDDCWTQLEVDGE